MMEEVPMLNQLRAEALALIAVTSDCTRSTIGPAGVQASIVPCLVREDLVLSVFLASIFLSRRGLAILALVNIGGLLMLPIVLPAAIPTYALLVTPLFVNTIGAAIAFIFLWHRDQVERDRQASLQASTEQ